MTTKLRLLLDEALTNRLAEALERCCSALNVRYIRDMPGYSGTEDNPLMQYAKRERRILVTIDTGINDQTCPPCTHPGIIRLALHRKHEAIAAKVFQKFLLSGNRKHTKGAVTFLSQTCARIVSHEGVKTYPLA